MSLITMGDTALLEHKLNVARAERGWEKDLAARANSRPMTPAAAARREVRPNPLGMMMAKVLNGGLFAAVAVWMTRLFATTPDGLRSKEHELPAMGMKWTSDPTEDELLVDEPRQASGRRAEQRIVEQAEVSAPSNLVLFAGERVIGAPRASDRYPTLAVIDRARDDDRLGFAEDPDAARLEHLARKMTEQFWSEMAWITGFVPERAFTLVCEALDRERAAAAHAVEVTADLGTAA